METELIAKIRTLSKEFALQSDVLALGIGDDMALLQLQDSKLLVSSDMLLEGVHFEGTTPPFLIGRKALAVNLSDVASMAGFPIACTVSLGIPKSRTQEWILEVMRGVFSLAKEFDLQVAGGDSNVWDGPFVIDIAILARPHPLGVVTRHEAKNEDRIFVTGPLGGSIHGKHLNFLPRVKEAVWLKDSFKITSMIDISDGLGKDLREILSEKN